VRRRQGFGAIVGDEYAAGKTLQGLLTIFNAFGEPEAAQQPASLIVVTKTLFFEGRWQQDAERFLPSMRLLRIAGTSQVARLSDLRGHHAVLATYDAIVANLEAFQRIRWNVIACDEGHKLGNSATNKAKAIESLPARQKLIVTGSPMQNSPRELWSVMNIAVPGLLRHKAWFDRTFPRARVVAGDDPAQMKELDAETRRANAARLTALGKLIAPFYLRRTNDELGRSLPMINEVNRAVVLEEEQARVYEVVRASCHERVRALIEQAGFDRSKQEIIVTINRLRQVCADPRLIKRAGASVAPAASAKLDAVRDICRELAQEGKKTVVVSEWTGMLQLIGEALTAEGLACDILHGELSGPARQRASQGFRVGKTQVMLIQLVLAEGIELPEGDAIILYEPWWNSKREEQAIGRLRRDERDKHVTVVRLVVPGSVEVGVQRVAQAKLADIDAVLQGHAATGRGGGLSLADVTAILRPLDVEATDEAAIDAL
jgi:SNF2 family DNA or RNA helicase